MCVPKGVAECVPETWWREGDYFVTEVFFSPSEQLHFYDRLNDYIFIALVLTTRAGNFHYSQRKTTVSGAVLKPKIYVEAESFMKFNRLL